MSLQRKHSGHLRSLDAWAHTSPGLKNKEEEQRFDELFEQMQESKIGICVTSCPSFQEINGKCSAFGGMAPLGETCRARALVRGGISRENSRG